MQRTVVEVLYLELSGNFTSLENPNFECNKTYGCMVSGFPIYQLGIGGALVSRSHDLDIAVPVFCRYNRIWFENVTRSYWG